MRRQLVDQDDEIRKLKLELNSVEDSYEQEIENLQKENEDLRKIALASNDGKILPDNLLDMERMTVEQLDYLQRGIKNIGQSGQRSGNLADNEIRQITDIRQTLLDDVDGQLRATNPAGISPYAQARSFWHDEMEYDRAFQRGLQLGKSDSVSADDVLFEFRQMSDAEKEAVKLGMVSGVINKIEGKGVTQEGYSIPNTGRFITERFEKILGGLFPDGTTVSDFMTKMRLETDTGATYTKSFLGSPTSVRETEQRFAPLRDAESDRIRREIRRRGGPPGDDEHGPRRPGPETVDQGGGGRRETSL